MSDGTKVTEATSREVALMKSRMEAQVGRQRTLLDRQAAYARSRISADLAMRTSERQQMAENLHAIIEAACAVALPGGARVTKAAITEAAGMSDGNGKSTRLYQYALDPTLSAEVRRKRAQARLTQKPAGYLKLAETAAELAGFDRGRIAVDLVQGTRLAEGMDALPEEEEAEHLVMLAKAIQGQAKRIARDTALDWYFRVIDDHGLVPNGDAWEADHEAFMWQWQTVPWVNLFTEQVAVFEGVWFPVAADGKVTKDGQGKAVWVCRRVSLALAPFGPSKEVRAYLVRRPALVVAPPPRRSTEARPFSLADIDLSDHDVFSCFPDPDGWLRTGRGSLYVKAAPEIRSVAMCPTTDFPGDDHEFIEVTAANLTAVLETGLPQAPNVAGDAFPLPVAAYTMSPPGSRAANLEQVLLHGQHGTREEDSRLTIRLEAVTRRYVDGLRAWVDAQTARIEDSMAKLAEGAC